jgi:hypothetical protein
MVTNIMMYIKPTDMFNLVEVAQDALGAIIKDNRVPTNEEDILIRDALIEANKMRIALERISTLTTDEKEYVNKFYIIDKTKLIANNALKLIQY